MITLRSLIFSFSQTMAYFVDLCQEGPQLSCEMTKIPLMLTLYIRCNFNLGGNLDIVKRIRGPV